MNYPGTNDCPMAHAAMWNLVRASTRSLDAAKLELQARIGAPLSFPTAQCNGLKVNDEGDNEEEVSGLTVVALPETVFPSGNHHKRGARQPVGEAWLETLRMA